MNIPKSYIGFVYGKAREHGYEHPEWRFLRTKFVWSRGEIFPESEDLFCIRAQKNIGKPGCYAPQVGRLPLGSFNVKTALKMAVWFADMPMYG